MNISLAMVKDILVRAGWTALQAGLAVVVAAGSGWVDVQVWKYGGIVAIAAALAAIKTAVSYPLTPSPELPPVE